MLLNSGEENTELEELIVSLEKLKNRDVYDKIKVALPTLETMYSRGAGTLVKPPEYLPVDNEYKYIHEKSDLIDAMLRILSREDMAKALITERPIPVPKRIIYSVTEKTSELLSKLKQFGSEKLSTIFESNESRTELVATFIALLELCRSGNIAISGDDENTIVSYIDDDN
jgi:segregation and condensation protein A